MSTRAQRTSVIESLENVFRDASGIFVTDNHKINVDKITKFRSELRKEGIQFIVVKNSLAQNAAKKSGQRTVGSFF